MYSLMSSWIPGHPDRLLRRAARVRGRHHQRVRAHCRAALRCSPGAQRPAPGRRRDAGQVAAELRKIYTAPDADAALDALAEFSASPWAAKYPLAAKVFEDAWDCFTPFLAFGPATRKLLYTTNSIESLNYQLRKVTKAMRKVTKARGHFPNDDAAVKLLWLAIINIEDKRARERAARRAQTGKRSDQPVRLAGGQRVMGWREALNELDCAYPGRLR